MRLRLALVVTMALTITAAGCGDDEAAHGAARTTTTARAPATTTAAVTTTAAPATIAFLPTFPPEREELEHGGSTWAVVLAAAGTQGDPTLAAAAAAARQVGYEHVVPTDCDEGAAVAIGQPDQPYTVSVYFRSEADARAAAQAFEVRDFHATVAELRTFCLD